MKLVINMSASEGSLSLARILYSCSSNPPCFEDRLCYSCGGHSPATALGCTRLLPAPDGGLQDPVALFGFKANW